MTYICIIRHGATDWNSAGIIQGREDIPLNAEGKNQAEMCAKALKSGREIGGIAWSQVFTSPLKRAISTAEIIAKHLDVALPIVDGDLIERDYGELSGLAIQPYPAGLQSTIEPFEELCERTYAALNRIAETGQNSVIVSHGGVINSILHVLTADSSEPIGSGKTRLSNGSISIIKYDSGKFAVGSYSKMPDWYLHPLDQIRV